MGWKCIEEVIAYQLSRELRRHVLRVTRRGPASTDWDFRKQIRDSARSAPRNLSEGFARYNHGEFAYHTNVAKASLAETQTHLEDGYQQKYFSQEDFEIMWRLARRIFGACSGLLRRLQTSEAPPPYWSKDAIPTKRQRRKSVSEQANVNKTASEPQSTQRTPST